MSTSSDWDDVTLGDMATLHRGYDLPADQRRDGAVPVVSSSGITGFHDQSKIQPPGVVTGRYGTLGQVFYIEEPFWPLNTTLYVSDFHGNDRRFISYFLQCQNLGGLDAASAVPGINRNVLHRLPAKRPPLPIQEKIATFLSAFDDLIENNSRRIAVLEEVSKRIYREWFVDFRFPGYEMGSLVDSELGPIPEGWQASTLGTVIVNFDRQRKPLSGMVRALRPGPYPYFGAAKIFDFIDDYIFDGTYLLVAEDGSVITSSGTPVLQYVSGKFWANNHTHIVQGSRLSTEHIYLLLAETQVRGFITGAAQPKITQANMNRIPCVVPSPQVAELFDRAIVPHLRQVLLLGRQTEILRESRDLLLPKLISGEIDLSDLNIDMPQAAA
jgi:type I restriction enzyme S subunit